MKCKDCMFYMDVLDTCMFCDYVSKTECDEDFLIEVQKRINDDKYVEHLKESLARDKKWDILNLKEEDGWEHMQIQQRLFDKGIECLFADIWFDDNIAFILGCKNGSERVARALNVHEEVIYNDFEHGLMILNLFQEKYLRGLLE